MNVAEEYVATSLDYRLVRPPWTLEPVDFRCDICKERLRRSPSLSPESPPILARIEPTDPRIDERWERLVIARQLRAGNQHADQVARERSKAWRAAGRPSTTDPGTLLADRMRWVDVAVVDVVTQSTAGAEWDGVLDLRCLRCSHVPRITVGAMVDGARRAAKTRRRAIYI